MKKITLLTLLLVLSCFAFAITWNATPATLESILSNVTLADQDVINLAAGDYYPPEVTMTFADFWNDGTGATTIEKTFNAFVVPEKDITLSGASTLTVIFDRNIGVDENDWQFAFVFFSNGEAVDETGITFENFTIQNLDYGLVNSWALTKEYIDSPDCSYMEYTSIANIDFNDISQSAIILEPRFYEGSKGSNNTDLFSEVNYDWESLSFYGNGLFSMSSGYAEKSSMCEIDLCNFNVGGTNPKADNFNKTMVNLVSAMAHVNACQFESGWRGIQMYGGSAGTWDAAVKMDIENNVFTDFDGAAYPGISVNIPDPPEEYDQSDEYYVGRCVGIYYQASTFDGEFYSNNYNVSNGTAAVWTDGLRSDISNYENFNYIGSPGWARDIHNVRSHIVIQNSNFYIFDDGLGLIITKHGCPRRVGFDVNDPDKENYDYLNAYGTLNEPVTITNCNFYGVNTANPSYPGNGSAIFLEDWEHHDRDGWGVTDAYRQGEIAMVVEDCHFEGFYAGFFVDGGRPDNLYAVDFNDPGDDRWAKNDDGRIQLLVRNSKFVDCEYSFDFSYWDQWVRTSSFIMLENNYYGTDADPYTTFNMADDFPAEDSFYELDYSGEWSSATTQTGYTYGQGATQRSYSDSPESPVVHTVGGVEYDNWHVYRPQFLQYLPYYKDFDMTELSGGEVENLVLTRNGTDIELDWDDNANPDVEYAVYAANDPYTANWGEPVATVDVSEYDYDASGLSEKYFMVAIVIPNMVDKFCGINNLSTRYGASIVYEESEHVSTIDPLGEIHNYEWPDDFDYPIDFYYGDPLAIQTEGQCDLKYYYADIASYEPTKAGFMKQTLTYTGTSYNFISLPFEGEYDTVAELAAYLELTTTDAISNWNVTTQGWESASYSGSWEELFVPEVSNSYYVTAGSAHDIYMMGAIPESPTYNLITTATTDLNFIMIPLNSTLTTAAELGADMGNTNAVMISQWDAANQSWQSCVYLDTFTAWINSFEINPAMPLMIGAELNFTWPQ